MEHEDVKKQETFLKTRFLEDELQSTQKVNIFAIKKKNVSQFNFGSYSFVCASKYKTHSVI